MSKECRSSNDEAVRRLFSVARPSARRHSFGLRHSCFFRHSDFVIRHFQVTEVGVEPTDKITGLSNRPLSQFAYSAVLECGDLSPLSVPPCSSGNSAGGGTRASPTKVATSRRTPKLRVQESHLACGGYEPLLGPRPPAMYKLQAPVSSRANRPYEGQPGACPPAAT